MKTKTEKEMGAAIILAFYKAGYNLDEAVEVLRGLLITGKETILESEKEAQKNETNNY